MRIAAVVLYARVGGGATSRRSDTLAEGSILGCPVLMKKERTEGGKGWLNRAKRGLPSLPTACRPPRRNSAPTEVMDPDQALHTSTDTLIRTTVIYERSPPSSVNTKTSLGSTLLPPSNSFHPRP